MDCDYGKERRIRIADRLRHERENKEMTLTHGKRKGQFVHGLTQAELATELLISKPTIITWERKDGKNKIPSMDQIITMCEFYNCDFGYLLGEYDSRKHKIADIQNQIGLSEQAIDILHRAKVITGGRHDVLEDMLADGIISIDDFERNKAQTTEMKLRLINTFIENCNEIASSLNSIETFRKEHVFYNEFYAIEYVRKSFNEIYDPNGPDHYGQWIDFLNEVRPHISHGEIKDGIAEEMIANQIYEIWLGLIDEAEHRTENQHRYSINREFERIIDKIINEN